MYKDLVKNKQRHIQQKIETVAIPDIEVLTGYCNSKYFTFPTASTQQVLTLFCREYDL